MTNRQTCREEGCGSIVLLPDGRCFNHTTLISDEEKQAARLKGGNALKRRAEFTAEDLEEFRIEPTAEAALQCQLEAVAALRAALAANPTDAKIIGQLSMASKRLSQQVMAVDIEQRLRRIEEQLGKRKPKKGK